MQKYMYTYRATINKLCCCCTTYSLPELAVLAAQKAEDLMLIHGKYN